MSTSDVPVPSPQTANENVSPEKDVGPSPGTSIGSPFEESTAFSSALVSVPPEIGSVPEMNTTVVSSLDTSVVVNQKGEHTGSPTEALKSSPETIVDELLSVPKTTSAIQEELETGLQEVQEAVEEIDDADPGFIEKVEIPSAIP